jgi:hypothetical protein
MIKRCIMIFPKFENIEQIELIRRKYDPLVNHVEPHITLITGHADRSATIYF